MFRTLIKTIIKDYNHNFRIASRRCSGVGFEATDHTFNLHSKRAASVVGPMATN
jgi:hypothetical protein